MKMLCVPSKIYIKIDPCTERIFFVFLTFIRYVWKSIKAIAVGEYQRSSSLLSEWFFVHVFADFIRHSFCVCIVVVREYHKSGKENRFTTPWLLANFVVFPAQTNRNSKNLSRCHSLIYHIPFGEQMSCTGFCGRTVPFPNALVCHLRCSLQISSYCMAHYLRLHFIWLDYVFIVPAVVVSI